MISYQFLEHGKLLQKVMQETPKPSGTEVLVRVTRSVWRRLRKGGRYVLCGLFGGELVHPLPPFAQRAIGIVGSYVGNLQELKEVVALAKRKKLKATPVSTRPASEVNPVLQDLKAGKVLGRMVLDLEATES